MQLAELLQVVLCLRTFEITGDAAHLYFETDPSFKVSLATVKFIQRRTFNRFHLHRSPALLLAAGNCR